MPEEIHKVSVFLADEIYIAAKELALADRISLTKWVEAAVVKKIEKQKKKEVA